MTRIIVKNLPNSATADKLRQTFSQKGYVTDLQLKYTKDGKFRHFAFVGYKTNDEADAAQKYFNNTYFGSCKIQVEKCDDLGISKKKKLSKTTNLGEPPMEKSKTKHASQDEEIDPAFAEFVDVHSTANKRKLVADNPQSAENVKSEKSKNEDDDALETPKEADNKELSDLEYLKLKGLKKSNQINNDNVHSDKKETKANYFTVKVRGFPWHTKKKEVKQFFAPLKPKSIRIPLKIKGVAYVGFLTEKECAQALKKHRSFFDGQRIFVAQYIKKSKNEDDVGNSGNERWAQQESAADETVAESGRIFIRNLSYSVTQEELEALFTPFGPLAEIHLPIDKFSRKVKGFAFVTFVFPEHAVKAYTALDGTVFQGRMLHLMAAQVKSNPDETSEETSDYKKKQAKKRKAEAGSSHNWNTLFLGSDAVASVMADRYDTTKQQVLTESEDPRGPSIAVRLALGETQIVAETKQFLIDNGIQLQAFDEGSKQRSKTVILVKNLPANTRVEDLRELFAPHGELGRVLLPPNGITAVVEFLEPTEAKIAFRKLAYTKFYHIPLYLEWAPVGVFVSANPKPLQVKESREGTQQLEKPEEKADNISEPIDSCEADTTVFVKNLNFSTTDESLRAHFEKCGTIFSASVAKKKDTKNRGQFLSMGYGFVQFYKKEGANNALKELQHSSLDGHTIELKRSHKTVDTNPVHRTHDNDTNSVAKTSASTKILVRNIPFEAKTREVADLFKTYGELKAVRLPKKSIGGTHRGFAFIEFLTKEDAKRAFDALCLSTHLYGRRLVLEWAANETVEDIRRRTASHFVEDSSAQKRGKIDVDSVGEMD